MAGLKFLAVFFLVFNYSHAVCNVKNFPDNFWFGVATSAYQVEGGWNADGKGLNVWDDMVHRTPSPVKNGDTGDVACDSYHRFESDDLEMLKYLGVKHYRFSISWTRILPTGLTDQINEPGVQYYKNMIKLLRANNIIPLVTIYHWDTPLALENLGGVLNETFIDWFANYSRVCFELFGDQVDHWTTFNEALIVCSYVGSEHPYQCAHNILRAHAAAYHIYDKEFREKQGGKVSMVHAIGWYEPISDNKEDKEASERKMQFDLGWFGNPIYHGDYPDVMKQRVGDRLPKFTEEEKALMKGTSDYFCFNSYNSALVQDNSNGSAANPSRDDDIAVKIINNANYTNGAWGVLPLLKWVQSHYDDPDIIMTENGLGVEAEQDTLEDDDRKQLLQDYLTGIREAITEGIRIFGYTHWSLMDNFEWNEGYSRKFGLYHVNFTDPNRTKTPRASVDHYKFIIQNRCLD